MKISAEVTQKIKITRDQKLIKQHGGFGIEILFPGQALGTDGPTGTFFSEDNSDTGISPW